MSGRLAGDDPLAADVTASALAAAVRARRVRASDVIDATLARIRAHDRLVNAFVATCDARAVDDARALDAALAQGADAGPLAGVPFAVKAMIDVAGITTSAGSRLHAGDPPAARDASVVSRLRAAGAICVGAANMDEFGLGGTTENALFGATRNPHDPSRTAGGSSGGSAAAVAAGFVPLAVGGDALGSIRLPASLCGVYGLRPTRGTISDAGVVGATTTIGTLGAFARSAADVALSYDAMREGGTHGASGVAPPASVAGLRFAIAGGSFRDGLAADAAEALAAAADALGASRVVDYPEPERARAAATLIYSAESASGHLGELRRRADDFDPRTRDRFLAHALIPAAWYLRAQEFRAGHRERALRLLGEIDVLLLPATPCTAPPLETATLAIRGTLQPAGVALGAFTQPLAPIDCPVLTVPIARGARLPIGVQLLAAPAQEAKLFRAAAHLEACGVACAPVA
jgi:AtzE family amidohydrolase